MPTDELIQTPHVSPLSDPSRESLKLTA
uniref:Uncharacterized protein n=1 Tax=Anguilla anguilla TaxID=7936 RepID=A0A0E9PZH4_ANGAN